MVPPVTFASVRLGDCVSGPLGLVACGLASCGSAYMLETIEDRRRLKELGDFDAKLNVVITIIIC
jgi:hypothetical protein